MKENMMVKNAQPKGFAPIEPDQPTLLILGTMPGIPSLEKQEYYANPRNQFWKFMGEIYGAHPDLPYEERATILKEKNVALWDVLESCDREGSLDSKIRNPVANDFEKFFEKHPRIKRIVFTCRTAEKLYLQLVAKNITHAVEYRYVPSPSPTHSAMRYEEKLERWREALTL